MREIYVDGKWVGDAQVVRTKVYGGGEATQYNLTIGKRWEADFDPKAKMIEATSQESLKRQLIEFLASPSQAATGPLRKPGD